MEAVRALQTNAPDGALQPRHEGGPAALVPRVLQGLLPSAWRYHLKQVAKAKARHLADAQRHVLEVLLAMSALIAGRATSWSTSTMCADQMCAGRPAEGPLTPRSRNATWGAPTATDAEPQHRMDSWRARVARGEGLESRYTRLQRRNLAFVRTKLEQGCVDCGSLDLTALEFDHIGPKRFTVMKGVWEGCSLARLAEEVANCQVRCANCHRRQTAERSGHFRHHGRPAPVAQR